MENKKNGICYYKCREGNCSGRAILKDNAEPYISKEHSIEHFPHLSQAKRFKYIGEMKQQAISEGGSVAKVHRKGLASAQRTGDGEHFPSYSSSQSAIHRAVLAQQPPISDSRADLVLRQDVQNIVIFDSEGENRILIFSSQLLLQKLAETLIITVDGTFKFVPNQFAQMVVIHGKLHGEWKPLVFLLLPSKTEDIYVAAFRELRRVMENQNLHPRFTKSVTDYEQGLFHALGRIWPQLEIKGCLFHFGQCVWRRAAHEGLTTAYAENNEIKMTVRRLLALPLVPMHFQDDAWLIITGEAPDDQRVNGLIDYVANTWHDENHATFNKEMWIRYAENDRTSNAAEGYNSRWNKANNNNPNFHR
jgi:hypothetical protein